MPAPQEFLLRLKPALHPPRQSPSGILRERIPALTIRNRRVRVTEQRRWQEDGATPRETDHHVQFPYDEMAPFVCVEVPKRNHRTPSCRNVQVIFVRPRARLRSKVERRCGEDTVLEVLLQARLIVTYLGQYLGVVAIHVRGDIAEGTCKLLLS